MRAIAGGLPFWQIDGGLLDFKGSRQGARRSALGMNGGLKRRKLLAGLKVKTRGCPCYSISKPANSRVIPTSKRELNPKLEKIITHLGTNGDDVISVKAHSIVAFLEETGLQA